MQTNLKQLRLSSNLNTSDMAKKIDVTLRTYQNYENGSTEMSYSTLIKTADFFDCSIDYLLGHQAKNTVYLDTLTKTQQEAIGLIKSLDDKEVSRVIGYIERMKDVPLQEVIMKQLQSEDED